MKIKSRKTMIIISIILINGLFIAFLIYLNLIRFGILFEAKTFMIRQNYEVKDTNRNRSKLMSVLSSQREKLPLVRHAELFIVFSTQSHEGLLEVLVKSIHHFSTRSILAYGIDYDITLSKIEYPRLLTKKLDRDSCGGYNLYSCKPYAIMITDVDYGVYLDVDSIANYNIDLLFDVVKSWNGTHPLSPIHPKDPDNQIKFMKEHVINKKSMPYVHAHILWNRNNIDFIKEWWELTKVISGSNYDETALNLLLWKHNAKHSVCAYDPISYVYSDYLKNRFKEIPHLYVYFLFHGGKNATQSFEILKDLSLSEPKNELLQVTCCPLESTESTINPLICKYQN